MAIAFVQKKSGKSGLGTIFSFAQTFTSTTTAGNLLLAVVAANSGFTVTGVSDSNGNTFTQAAESLYAAGVQVISLWYKENAAGGSSNVVTASTGSSAQTAMAILEFSGAATSSSLDQTNTTANTTTTTPTTGNVTTANAGELYLGGLIFSTFGVTPPITTTDEGGWTNIFNDTGTGGQSIAWDAQYLIGGAGGTFAGTWTLDQSCICNAAIATFKAAGGGGGGAAARSLFRPANLTLGGGGSFFSNPLE